MIEKIKAVLALFPVVIAAVKSVEDAIPGAANGKAKLDMILKSVLAAHESAGNLIPVITKMIEIIVAGLNAVGIFKK